MRENENASHAEPKASASFALRPQRRVLGFFVFCFVLVLFLFLFVCLFVCLFFGGERCIP